MIIAVDFDGTLCKNCWPEIGEANWRLIRWLAEQRRKGDKVILWTCRTGEMLDKAVMWCLDNGLRFDAVNANLPERIMQYGNDCRKVSADLYLDDRSAYIDRISPFPVYVRPRRREAGRCWTAREE